MYLFGSSRQRAVLQTPHLLPRHHNNRFLTRYFGNQPFLPGYCSSVSRLANNKPDTQDTRKLKSPLPAEVVPVGAHVGRRKNSHIQIQRTHIYKWYSARMVHPSGDSASAVRSDVKTFKHCSIQFGTRTQSGKTYALPTHMHMDRFDFTVGGRGKASGRVWECWPMQLSQM